MDLKENCFAVAIVFLYIEWFPKKENGRGILSSRSIATQTFENYSWENLVRLHLFWRLGGTSLLFFFLFAFLFGLVIGRLSLSLRWRRKQDTKNVSTKRRYCSTCDRQAVLAKVNYTQDIDEKHTNISNIDQTSVRNAEHRRLTRLFIFRSFFCTSQNRKTPADVRLTSSNFLPTFSFFSSTLEKRKIVTKIANRRTLDQLCALIRCPTLALVELPWTYEFLNSHVLSIYTFKIEGKVFLTWPRRKSLPKGCFSSFSSFPPFSLKDFSSFSSLFSFSS